MELLKKVRATIRKYSMLSDGDSVLIGLSGGPDSVCMTIILGKLKDELNIILNAVYIDHCLRPDETGNEAAFCSKLCDKLEIGFFLKTGDAKKSAEEKKLNLQEAAREIRYRIFEELSSEVNATKIAIGHTADDQAETFLMRSLRGSGVRGLSGIPPVRGNIIRPLIETEKIKIEKFLEQDVSQSFITDSSNRKEDYLRNWLRGTIIPELKKKNPALIKSICRASDILREEDEYLEIIVTKTLMRLISRKSDNNIELFLTPLETISKPVLRRVLRRAISETKGLAGVDFIHIEDIIRLIEQGKPGDMLNLPKAIRAVREYSLLKITSDPVIKLSGYEITPPSEVAMSETGTIIRASFEEAGAEMVEGRASVLLDAGGMVFPLKVRPRAAGDFFYPSGLGKKKKLQDFFVDEKIPREERDKIPLILSGDNIVWVAGLRADDRFRVTDRTEKFLRLIISKAKTG